jgi:hypothetical protein
MIFRSPIALLPHRLPSHPCKDVVTALLQQSRRGGDAQVSQELVQRILADGERLPIILQALGKMRGEGVDISVSLAGLGRRVLTGLSDRMRTALIRVAYGQRGSLSPYEEALLVSLGALRRQKGGRKNGRKLVVASETLKEFIRQSQFVTQALGREKVGTPQNKRQWVRHGRLLHLSDLHFGPKCIEDGESVSIQLRKLIDALERSSSLRGFPSGSRSAEDGTSVWLGIASCWCQAIMIRPGC